MNRVKFMNYPVDEAAHQAVHEAPTWGFPPEVEAEDWESLRQAAEHYHKLGSPVFAYVQSSNCVYGGSFVDKDWYARDAKGRKVYYYSWAWTSIASCCLIKPCLFYPNRVKIRNNPN